MKIGFIGLGKMGSRMVSKLLQDKHDVVVWNRSSAPVEDLRFKIQDLRSSKTIKELVDSLSKPRIVWLMLPAGEATQNILDEISKYVQPGDIVIDGGNAHFKDTEKRYQEFKKNGIKFLGIGVSGGIIASEKGYPLMVGGERAAYGSIVPLLDCLSKPNGGHEYFGEGGAGHFVKMVHNAIEYGYMQSLGEGFGVLEKSEYNFDLTKIAKLYQKGSLISGFMMDRVVDALTDPEFSSIQGVIGKASGETVWAIEEAKKKNLPIEIIEKSLEFRNKSEADPTIQNSFAAKLVSALRKAFGGHSVKK